MVRHALYIFTLLSFILSGISPACAFVSGQSSLAEIEICTAQGLKTVRITGGETPQKEEHKDHAKKNGCAFCFAQTHIGKIFSSPPVTVKSVRDTAVLLTAWNQQSHARHELHSLSARAPPVIL